MLHSGCGSISEQWINFRKFWKQKQFIRAFYKYSSYYCSVTEKNTVMLLSSNKSNSKFSALSIEMITSVMTKPRAKVVPGWKKPKYRVHLFGCTSHVQWQILRGNLKIENKTREIILILFRNPELIHLNSMLFPRCLKMIAGRITSIKQGRIHFHHLKCLKAQPMPGQNGSCLLLTIPVILFLGIAVINNSLKYTVILQRWWAQYQCLY